MLWELIKMSWRYELPILRERSAARATVTGWLSRVMIRPVRVLGSRATPSWMNSAQAVEFASLLVEAAGELEGWAAPALLGGGPESGGA
jgi:hypothetical protein